MTDHTLSPPDLRPLSGDVAIAAELLTARHQAGATGEVTLPMVTITGRCRADAAGCRDLHCRDAERPVRAHGRRKWTLGRERPCSRARRRPSFTRDLGQAPLRGPGWPARPQANIAPGRHSR